MAVNACRAGDPSELRGQTALELYTYEESRLAVTARFFCAEVETDWWLHLPFSAVAEHQRTLEERLADFDWTHLMKWTALRCTACTTYMTGMERYCYTFFEDSYTQH